MTFLPHIVTCGVVHRPVSHSSFFFPISPYLARLWKGLKSRNVLNSSNTRTNCLLLFPPLRAGKLCTQQQANTRFLPADSATTSAAKRFVAEHIQIGATTQAHPRREFVGSARFLLQFRNQSTCSLATKLFARQSMHFQLLVRLDLTESTSAAKRPVCPQLAHQQSLPAGSDTLPQAPR
jgi:hypothetical protein